jgi:hypothetical protein
MLFFWLWYLQNFWLIAGFGFAYIALLLIRVEDILYTGFSSASLVEDWEKALFWLNTNLATPYAA